MKILPLDTETSGFPDYKKPSNAVHQPHIVQLGAVLVDSETKEEIDYMDVIIKPDGWIIPQECIDVHGITMERAMDEGIPEPEALEMFMSLYDKCDLRIAHNTTFDNRILRIAMKRFLPKGDESTEIMRSWKEDKNLYYCTLINSRKIMGGKSGHTLPEALKYFTGKEMENAHDAMADLRACLEIYFEQKLRNDPLSGAK